MYVNVIFYMYDYTKPSLQINDRQCEYFPCLIGLHHWVNVHPFFFSIFLNDLKKNFLIGKKSMKRRNSSSY